MASAYNLTFSRWLCLFLLLFPLAAQAQLDARLDRPQINEGETVNLLITASGSEHDDSLDVSALAQDFEVLGRSQSTQVQMINSQTSATTQWQITLAPKRQGDLVVPPVKLGQQETPALVLQVRPASQADKPASGQEIFLRAELDRAEGYEQQQLIYTVRLYHKGNLRGGSLNEPQPTGAKAQKLGEDAQYRTTLDGQAYAVIERRYAVFPDAPGTLSIPPLVFDGEVSAPRQQRPRSNDPFDRFFDDPFFGATQRVHLRAPEVKAEIKSRPAQFPGAWWLPAQDLTLAEQWNPDSVEWRVGEPVTRTFTLRATGLGGAQLPELPASMPTDLKAYPDQPQIQDTQAGNGVIGQRQQKIALVPSQPGMFSLPEIRLPWWDTASDSLRWATLPAREIKVLPATGQAAQVAPALEKRVESPVLPGNGTEAAAGQPLFWQGLSAGLALAWLLTLAAWWRNRRPPQPAEPAERPGLRAACQSAQRACQAGDAQAARQGLLAWAAARWPDAPPNLGGLGQRLDDPAAARALAELDQVLYAAASQPWDGVACWQAVAPALARAKSAPLVREAPLPRLYPQTLSR